MKVKTPWIIAAGFLAGLALTWVVRAGVLSGAFTDAKRDELPRFTEEREAAALHFVRKNAPELMPLLDQLRKSNVAQYEREVREIFQVTEWLADLKDDQRRHDLELKIWIGENKANAVIARLSTPSEEERKKYQQQLQDLAKELVELDAQVLELKAEQLDKELGAIRSDLSLIRDNPEKKVKERYEALLEQVRNRKK
jgi:hypothetical protein